MWHIIWASLTAKVRALQEKKVMDHGIQRCVKTLFANPFKKNAYHTVRWKPVFFEYLFMKEFRLRAVENRKGHYEQAAQWATIAHLRASINIWRQVTVLEIAIKPKLKHSRYYESSGYLQVVNRPG